MYQAVAFFSSAEGSWRIIIGTYETETEAFRACQEHARKHETDLYLQYYQVIDK